MIHFLTTRVLVLLSLLLPLSESRAQTVYDVVSIEILKRVINDCDVDYPTFSEYTFQAPMCKFEIGNILFIMNVDSDLDENLYIVRSAIMDSIAFDTSNFDTINELNKDRPYQRLALREDGHLLLYSSFDCSGGFTEEKFKMFVQEVIKVSKLYEKSLEGKLNKV